MSIETRGLSLAVAATVVGGLLLTGCTDDPKASSLETENKVQDDSYNALVKAEPAHVMTNPTTRETINFWIDTWNKPGALSYNYLATAEGGTYEVLGYYILKGLPVSYCTSLTPSYDLIDVNGDGDGVADFEVDATGVDGVYYGEGGCDRYYGEDATTGQYVEYTVPMNMQVRTSNQPLDNVQGAVPLGPSDVGDVE